MSLIGKKVKMTISQGVKAKGIVLDKIRIKLNEKSEETPPQITGYLVEDTLTGKVHSVPHFAITEII